MIVLFDTNAIMKIKLKYRKTFILNRKTKQEKGKDTKENEWVTYKTKSCIIKYCIYFLSL